jgi:hypothetical protein
VALLRDLRQSAFWKSLEPYVVKRHFHAQDSGLLPHMPLVLSPRFICARWGLPISLCKARPTPPPWQFWTLQKNVVAFSRMQMSRATLFPSKGGMEELKGI